MTFLLHGPSSFSTLWRRTLHQHIPRIPFYDRIEDIPDLKQVLYLATWDAPQDVGSLFPNLQVITPWAPAQINYCRLGCPSI